MHFTKKYRDQQKNGFEKWQSNCVFNDVFHGNNDEFKKNKKNKNKNNFVEKNESPYIKNKMSLENMFGITEFNENYSEENFEHSPDIFNDRF
jgi:hypothetical protein